jgi:ABC-2 type transport system permease protein
MSTSVVTSPTATPTSAQASPTTGKVRVTFPRVVRSEWIKLRTLRSTVWTLAATVAVMVGIVALFCLMITAGGDGGGNHASGEMPNGIIAFAIAANLAALVVAVLGVLIISGEYSTGMIRSTLAAVPRRLPALWAKGVVLAVSIFLVSAVAVGISLGIMAMWLGGEGLAPDLGDSESVRILVGTALYLTAIALLAFAIGALLRHSAGALATVLGLLTVIPLTFAQIPWKPLQQISPFLPSNAGSMIMIPAQTGPVSPEAVGIVFGPWQGFGVLLGWVVVLLAAAAVLLRRRNA